MFGPYPRASLKPKKKDETDAKEAQKLDLSLDEYRKYKQLKKLPSSLGAFARVGHSAPGLIADIPLMVYNIPQALRGKPGYSVTQKLNKEYDKYTDNKHVPTSSFGKIAYAGLESTVGLPGLSVGPKAVQVASKFFAPSVGGTIGAVAGQSAANNTNNPIGILAAGLGAPSALKGASHLTKAIYNTPNRYRLNRLKNNAHYQEAIENKIADIGGANDLLKMTDHEIGQHIRDATHTQSARHKNFYKKEYGAVNKAAEELNPKINIGHVVDDWIQDYSKLESQGARELALKTPAGKKVTELLSLDKPTVKFKKTHKTLDPNADDFANRFDSFLKNNYKGPESIKPASYNVANLFTKDINNSLTTSKEIGNVYQGQLKNLVGKLNNQIYDALPTDLANARRKVEDSYSVWAKTGKPKVNKILQHEHSPTEITRNFDYTIPENLSFVQEGMDSAQKNKLSQGILGQLGFENNKKINPVKLHDNLGKKQSTIEELIVNGLDPEQLSKLNKQHNYTEAYKKIVTSPASLSINDAVPKKISLTSKVILPFVSNPYKPLKQSKIDKTFEALEKQLQPPPKNIINNSGVSLSQFSRNSESEENNQERIAEIETLLAQNNLAKQQMQPQITSNDDMSKEDNQKRIAEIEALLAQNKIARQALNENK